MNQSLHNLNTRIAFFIFLSLLFSSAMTWAQVMPRSGTHFSFGIPEGPDALGDSTLGSSTSTLTVNILSAYSGKGVIESLTGYCQEFIFTPNKITTIALPHSFMHLRDLGKTNKGILIKTSQPVNVVLHDFLEEAGEATQIYPDEALDTSYRITTWGIANDPPDNFGQEDNHSQFVITAIADNTDITIIPSVNTLGNHRARVPIQIALNRGECYIVKADVNGVPDDASLTNSTVSATKPVSILSAVTCGYVPLNVQSCNEVLDELLPKKYTDTIFYVGLLQDTLVENTVLFTSEVTNFTVFTTSGTSYPTFNGRVELRIQQPEMFQLTAPAQCFLLSEGSNIQNNGDPSMVTVLPRSQYTDTMFWYSPDFSDMGLPFSHYISVVYPQASEANVLLDGLPIASVSNSYPIISSPMSAAVAVIGPGVHTLTSLVPIFALAAGFNTADSYSFIPGTISPKLPEDTLPINLAITNTDAKTCRTFDVTINSSFLASDSIKNVELLLNYDPKILTVVSVQLGPLAQGGQWIADSRVPGSITLNANCLSPFSAAGGITTITFATGPAVTTTTISAALKASKGGAFYETISGTAKKDIAILEIRDTIKATVSIDGGHTRFTELDTATVRFTTIPADSVNEIDLFISYNHDLLSLQYADLRNTSLAGFALINPTTIDQTTDEIRIILSTPKIFTPQEIIARLIFKTFVSDSTSGTIGIRGVIGNTRPCPLDILADQVTGNFIGSDTCGYGSLRSLMLNKPFKINSIRPNPSNGSFTIDIDRHLFGGDALHISLIDMLGNEIWKTESASGSINQQIPCTLASSVPSGTYFIRVAAAGHTETQKIIIRN